MQGAVALDDTLSKGLPIETEIDALHSYLDGIDKDSVLDLVLSSLPEETRKNGIDTLLQLNQKASYFVCPIINIMVVDVVSPIINQKIFLNAVYCYIFITKKLSFNNTSNTKDKLQSFLLIGEQ